MTDVQKNIRAEKPKQLKRTLTQTVTDKELFASAKIDIRKLDKVSLTKIVDTIVDFAEIFSSIKFYKYEKDLAERIVWSLLLNEGETLTSQFARQGGKTLTVGAIIVSCAIWLPLFAQSMPEDIKSHLRDFKGGFWCGVYGPDYERAGLIGRKIDSALSSDTTKAILSSPDFGMVFPERVSSYIGYLPRNSIIHIKSANTNVSIEGDTWHLVVTDETQEVSDRKLKKSISPMLSSTNGTCVHLGSSSYEKCFFYDVIQYNKKRNIVLPKNKKVHFEADYFEVQKYNKKYKKYISKEKNKLGETSDEFRMSYLLWWPIEKGMFVTEDYLNSYIGRNYSVTPYDKTNDHVIGIDIAKKFDSTVATVIEVDWENSIIIDPDSGIVRHKKKIKNWYEVTGDDYDAQFHMLCDFIDNYKVSRIVVDATGVGEHMFDRLKKRYELKNVLVIPFVYNRPDKSYAFQLLYKELLSDPVQDRLTFPNSPKAKELKKHKNFMQQMTNLVKVWEGGYLNVEPNAQSEHDDYPNSLALAVWGIEEDLMEQAEEYYVENFLKVERSDRNNFFVQRRKYG